MAIGNFATSAATGGDDTAPMRWLSRTSQTRPATGDDGHDRILTSPEQRKADTIGLARHLSQQIPSNEANGDQMAVFNPVKGSDLDPFSPDFDIHKWVKALSRFGHSSGIDEARKASVAFSNLSVFGYGSDAGKFSKASVFPDVLQIIRRPSPTSSSLQLKPHLTF